MRFEDMNVVLIYGVRCKPAGQVFFETIAAFNCKPAADFYARDCRATNPTNVYKVEKLRED